MRPNHPSAGAEGERHRRASRPVQPQPRRQDPPGPKASAPPPPPVLWDGLLKAIWPPLPPPKPPAIGADPGAGGVVAGAVRAAAGASAFLEPLAPSPHPSFPSLRFTWFRAVADRYFSGLVNGVPCVTGRIQADILLTGPKWLGYSHDLAVW